MAIEPDYLEMGFAEIHPRMLPIGAVLCRRYKGRMYRVKVVAGYSDGGYRPRIARYEYRKKRYTSLDQVAFKITGTKVVGVEFFRLRRRRGNCRTTERKVLMEFM